MKLAFYSAPASDASGNGTFFDRVIEWRQRIGGGGYASRFVHVEFVFDEVGLASAAIRQIPPIVQTGDANGSLCYSSSPRDGGVRFKWIDLTDGQWTLVNLGVLSDAHLAQALEFCGARVGLAYDWLGILGFVLPWGEHEDGDRFCDESGIEVMQRSIVAVSLPARIAAAVAPLVRWRTDPAQLYRAVAPAGAIPEKQFSPVASAQWPR